MRIKILIVSLILLTTITSCGGFSRAKASLTGMSEECFRGVKYLQFTSGVTVAVDKNGKPLLCD